MQSDRPQRVIYGGRKQIQIRERKWELRRARHRRSYSIYAAYTMKKKD